MSRLSEALACLNVDCLASVRAAAATLASASAAATPVATRTNSAAGSATTSVGPQLGPTPDSAHVIAIEEASCALHVNLGIVQLAMVRWEGRVLGWRSMVCVSPVVAGDESVCMCRGRR